MNMSGFQSQGMMPEVTGEYGAYPDSSTVDVVATADEQRPRVVRQSAREKLYKPFHYLLLLYLFMYCSRIPELVPYAHIGMILQPILLIGMIMTGRVKAILADATRQAPNRIYCLDNDLRTFQRVERR